jgi:hypothetical protein
MAALLRGLLMLSDHVPEGVKQSLEPITECICITSEDISRRLSYEPTNFELSQENLKFKLRIDKATDNLLEPSKVLLFLLQLMLYLTTPLVALFIL